MRHVGYFILGCLAIPVMPFAIVAVGIYALGRVAWLLPGAITEANTLRPIWSGQSPQTQAPPRPGFWREPTEPLGREFRNVSEAGRGDQR